MLHKLAVFSHFLNHLIFNHKCDIILSIAACTYVQYNLIIKYFNIVNSKEGFFIIICVVCLVRTVCISFFIALLQNSILWQVQKIKEKNQRDNIFGYTAQPYCTHCKKNNNKFLPTITQPESQSTEQNHIYVSHSVWCSKLLHAVIYYSNTFSTQVKPLFCERPHPCMFGSTNSML